ncbi:hypothetical protein KRMM14A1004_49120 [Krasilnikovia sp. MM14-A1004]
MGTRLPTDQSDRGRAVVAERKDGRHLNLPGFIRGRSGKARALLPLNCDNSGPRDGFMA